MLTRQWMVDMVSNMLEQEVKPRSVQVKPDNVPDVESLSERIKTDMHIDMSFADTVNMLVREALEARKQAGKS